MITAQNWIQLKTGTAETDLWMAVSSENLILKFRFRFRYFVSPTPIHPAVRLAELVQLLVHPNRGNGQRFLI